MLMPLAGIEGAHPLVMGILNVTPDSFSDGGLHLDPIAAAMAMVEQGADIIDVGGESTRPGIEPTPVDVEIARIVPVIRQLAQAGVVVSVDTRNAATMQASLDVGARIINDVSALQHDPASAGVVAQAGCPVVLMHMRGNPITMGSFCHYDDVAQNVTSELAACVAQAEAAGIARANIIIDPGIGFSKTTALNIELLRHLEALTALGLPMLVGVSRKGFIGALSGEAEPRARAPGSIAAGLWAVSKGAKILRVHDVAQTVQAVRVWRELAQLS